MQHQNGYNIILQWNASVSDLWHLIYFRASLVRVLSHITNLYSFKLKTAQKTHTQHGRWVGRNEQTSLSLDPVFDYVAYNMFCDEVIATHCSWDWLITLEHIHTLHGCIAYTLIAAWKIIDFSFTHYETNWIARMTHILAFKCVAIL